MAFETSFENGEARDSCSLKGVVPSVSDYGFAKGLKELGVPMEINWEPEGITPLN